MHIERSLARGYTAEDARVTRTSSLPISLAYGVDGIATIFFCANGNGVRLDEQGVAAKLPLPRA